jgi:hypothetical protein
MIIRGGEVQKLPLDWARAENAHQAEVYIRPSRHERWPLVLLDDVEVGIARKVASKYAALVVRTSAEGGCHVWLRCRRPLDENERQQAQRWLAPLVNADRGSVSGEHLGRLAGFKNWKRRGTWVNVLDSSGGLAWDPSPALGERPATPRGHPSAAVVPPEPSGCDASPSGREWGWVCGLLTSGIEPIDAYERLLSQARHRRAADADRYALRTVQKARRHLQIA